MDQTEFERKYPELATILLDDVMNRYQDDHQLKICIERDREGALEMWSKLIKKSPAGELVETYENNIHLGDKFRAFVTELWCYQALTRWLCEDPQVLDRPDNQGMPDFACKNFDVDATLLQEADEEDRVRRKLEDIMGDRSYIGILSLKSKFDVQATNGERWRENENIINDFIDLIDQDLNPDNPATIETDVLKLEFKEKEQGAFGWVGTWERMRKLEPDGEDKIPERLQTKADQPRNGRPLVVFMDCKYTSIDYASEIRNILIGAPHGFAIREKVDISPNIQSISDEWNNYLVGIGAIPDPNDEREIARVKQDEESGAFTYRSFPAILPEEEGVFQEDDLEQIAGVMLRMKNGEVCYIPNVYTNAVDAKSIYDTLGWELETHKLTPVNL